MPEYRASTAAACLEGGTVWRRCIEPLHEGRLLSLRHCRDGDQWVIPQKCDPVDGADTSYRHRNMQGSSVFN